MAAIYSSQVKRYLHLPQINCFPQEADSVMSEHGQTILNCFVTLLQHDPSNEIKEQVNCYFMVHISAADRVQF